ncbi:hypothetical protein AB0N89_33935 [Amycolatopsis sp. NPDC089917]|uniref:hypothetical protein n=1 Tax=Amycolatopsis sp. NPDC089917 TaxID=3155187 RepID=UPI0034476F74
MVVLSAVETVVLADGSGRAGVFTLIGIVVGLAVVLTLIGIAQARDPKRRPPAGNDERRRTSRPRR